MKVFIIIPLCVYSQSWMFHNCKWSGLSAREFVPRNEVSVRLEDIMPADIKLFVGDYLLRDESALIYKSLPVEKD